MWPADAMEHAASHVDLRAHAPSLVMLLLLALLLVAYLAAVAKQNRSGKRWSRWRTANFIAGLLLLALAVSAPANAFAHADLRGHMVQHLLLGMFAPLGMVLGAPGTLVLRTVPLQAARSLVSFLDTGPVRVLIHPVSALMLDMGGMYLLYVTPLYALSVNDPVIHVLVHVHFLLSGYLFVWAVAGPDPVPQRPRMSIRLAVLFAGTAMHATLGKLMYAYGFPHGTSHSLAEVREAAKLMYYGGDVAELLLTIAFFSVWFRHRRRKMNSPEENVITTAA